MSRINNSNHVNMLLTIFALVLHGCTDQEHSREIISSTDTVYIRDTTKKADSVIRKSVQVKDGIIVDARDGKTYKTIQFDSITWMADNLNLDKIGSHSIGNCLSGSSDSCQKYGKLYTWSEALNAGSQYNDIALGTSDSIYSQGICPTGWHIPTSEEFVELARYSRQGVELFDSLSWGLKDSGSSCGFCLKPSGFSVTLRYVSSGYSDSKPGMYAYMWTSTERANIDAYVVFVSKETILSSLIGYIYSSKLSRMSVRCIKDGR